MTIPADVVRDNSAIQEAEREVVQFFEEWLGGSRCDSIFGLPAVHLRDGDKVIIGQSRIDSDDDLNRQVHWQSVFVGAGDRKGDWDVDRSLELFGELQFTIGSRHVDGFGHVVMERDENTVYVSGFIDFRVRDVYDFAEGQVIGLDLLEMEGEAKPFDVFTPTWRKRIEGVITFGRWPAPAVQAAVVRAVKQEFETWGDVRALVLRSLFVCFILWVGVDYVWYLRGWMVVPPHCVLESNPRRVCILEGAMTLALAHALTAYMERTENPDVVRPALYYAVGPNFAHYLKGAVQTIESDE